MNYSEDELLLRSSGIFYEPLREPSFDDPLWEEWDSENPGDPGPNWGYHLNMNDAFHYASADCEFVAQKDFAEIVRLITTYGANDGSLYWASIKRGYDPSIAKNREKVEIVRAAEAERNK